MPKTIDMTSKKYGSLTAINLIEYKPSNRNAVWLFSCECGNQFIAEGYLVRTGKVISCKECGRERTRIASVKHGMYRTPEYRTWSEIKTRCLNKNSFSYMNYGGRGISMCERWIASFDNFLEDMGRKPSNKHSIERINNHGNYEPGNCRWATIQDQANNKRNNIIIAYRGEKDTLPNWARKLGIRYSTLHQRIRIAGWSIEKAFNYKGNSK